MNVADILDRLAALFDDTASRFTCPVCGDDDYDAPGLLSHLFRRCDGKSRRFLKDAEIVATLREAAAKARASQ